MRAVCGSTIREAVLTQAKFEGCDHMGFKLEVVFQMEDIGGISHYDFPDKVKARFWRGIKDSRIKEATHMLLVYMAYYGVW